MTFDDISKTIFESKSLARYIQREKNNGKEDCVEKIIPVLTERLSLSLYEIKSALRDLSVTCSKHRIAKLPKRWSVNFADTGTLIYTQERGTQAFDFELEVSPILGVIATTYIEAETIKYLLIENNLAKEQFDHEAFIKAIEQEVERQLEFSKNIIIRVITPYGMIDRNMEKAKKSGSIRVSYIGFGKSPF